MSLPEVLLDRVLLPELLGADPTREDGPIVPQSFGEANLLVVAGPGVQFNRYRTWPKSCLQF